MRTLSAVLLPYVRTVYLTLPFQVIEVWYQVAEARPGSDDDRVRVDRKREGGVGGVHCHGWQLSHGHPRPAQQNTPGGNEDVLRELY